MSYDELQAFISRNLHLPGFPAAQTVEADGLDVADLIRAQQRTIEELTLRVLELNERLKKLE
jgi:hypothetical protein